MLFVIIKPYIWKKKEEKFLMLIMQLMHLRHFRGCQLLGPSTLTATNKMFLFWTSLIWREEEHDALQLL